MVRHYYVTAVLEELQQIEKELGANGFLEPQIHVLSERDEAVESHHLHQVSPVLKQDVVHGTEVGAILGVLAAIVILLLGKLLGWSEGPAGWIPLTFLAIILLGFCTWEGGFIGIQMPNVNFKRFECLLRQGRHVLFVDTEPRQEPQLASIIAKHPHLHAIGTGQATPAWVIRSQDWFKRFIKFMP